MEPAATPIASSTKKKSSDVTALLREHVAAILSPGRCARASFEPTDHLAFDIDRTPSKPTPNKTADSTTVTIKAPALEAQPQQQFHHPQASAKAQQRLAEQLLDETAFEEAQNGHVASFIDMSHFERILGQNVFSTPSLTHSLSHHLDIDDESVPPSPAKSQLLPPKKHTSPLNGK